MDSKKNKAAGNIDENHAKEHNMEEKNMVETNVKSGNIKKNDSHMHAHEDGIVHSHSKTEIHEHIHTNTKAVVNRLSRAIGHLEAVKKMVEDGRDCSEVLIQLAAVRSAINNTGKVILEDHIEHCIVDAIEDGDREAIDKLNKAINQFVK